MNLDRRNETQQNNYWYIKIHIKTRTLLFEVDVKNTSNEIYTIVPNVPLKHRCKTINIAHPICRSDGCHARMVIDNRFCNSVSLSKNHCNVCRVSLAFLHWCLLGPNDSSNELHPCETTKTNHWCCFVSFTFVRKLIIICKLTPRSPERQSSSKQPTSLPNQTKINVSTWMISRRKKWQLE